MVRRTFPRFAAAGLVALAAAAVAPAQSPNPWRVSAPAASANPWRVESSPVAVAPMPRPAGACCEAACCDKPVAVAPMPRAKGSHGIRIELSLGGRQSAPPYVTSQPTPAYPAAASRAVPLPTVPAPPATATRVALTQPVPPPAAPATPVPPAPAAPRATAAAPAFADVPARARLSGTWYRESAGVVVAFTFAGDELRVTSKQAVTANTTACLTLTADYAVTKDGTVHGVITGVDVDVSGDTRCEAALEVAGLATEIQSLVDQPFAFRTRSTTGGLMLNSLRVAGGPADGRFDPAVFAGLYKHAKDAAAVPCPKPVAAPVGGLTLPSPHYLAQQPQCVPPGGPFPLPRERCAMEFVPSGAMLPPPCPVLNRGPMPPGFTFHMPVGLPMPNACPVPPAVAACPPAAGGPGSAGFYTVSEGNVYSLGGRVVSIGGPPQCDAPPAVTMCPPMPTLSPPKLIVTDVIQMVQQGCPPDVIVKQIQGSGSHFTLTPENAGFLRLTGVPDAVVSVMQLPPAPPACGTPVCLPLCQPERVRVVAACEASPVKAGPRKMTLADVVDLIRAKAGDDVILTHAAMTGSTFTLTVADIKALKQAGASDALVLGLMQSGSPVNGYPADPNVRMERLLNQSEDLREIRETWRRFWFDDQPTHLTPERIHGGIMN